MQRKHPRYCRGQSGWNRRVAGVRPVLLPVHDVVVNRSVKRFLHLAGRAGKLQHGAALRRSNLESVRLQPACNSLNVCIGGPELLAEFGGREPPVVAGRGLVLLIVEKFPQGGLLVRTALQHQQHALHGKRGRRRAQLKLRARQGVCVSLQDGQVRFFHRLRDQRLGGSLTQFLRYRPRRETYAY